MNGCWHVSWITLEKGRRDRAGESCIAGRHEQYQGKSRKMEKYLVVRHCWKIPENLSGPHQAVPGLPGLRGIGHARRVTTQPTLPTLDEIVADLRLLRERGLVRIRHSDLSALETAVGYTEVPAAAGGRPGTVEELLRAAVSRLGDGSLDAAATAT